jgi:NADH-quinone oxidoreductase subunit G
MEQEAIPRPASHGFGIGQPKMSRIYIDHIPYEVNPAHNLLEACLSLGLNLPYFCWHPALGSVGACRQCAVKHYRDEQDSTGQLVMACMTPVTADTRISIDDADARAFRASIIEWLMLNHPHDCPVCDEGGECHLQDMTVMTGHASRRYRGLKRTYVNQDLGPFINHEMNRCIQCYRCVRFYQDYAGGKDLNVFGSRDQLYFGRFGDGVLENEFSGNLVEVCPTGVFTDRPLSRHYTRKWDLQTAPSLCVHCGVGCNTIVGEREGRLRRVLNRYNHDVNGYFLCDRGRFGYDFVNSRERVRAPLIRVTTTGRLESTEPASILETLFSYLGPTKRIMGIGSPRASLEANYALRCLVGADHFYSGLSTRESQTLETLITILRDGPVPSRTLQEVEHADAVLVLGEDLIHTAPRLALAIRQSSRHPALQHAKSLGIPDWHDSAVRNATPGLSGPLFVLHWANEGFQDIATKWYPATPDAIARIGFAIAHAIDSTAPAITGLSTSEEKLVTQIAGALSQAQAPLIVSGTGALNARVIEAAANIALGLNHGHHAPGLCFVVPECNSLGMGLMDAPPLEQALQTVEEHGIETVIILENDLFQRAEDRLVRKFLETVPHVVVVDHFLHETCQHAGYVLPAGTFAEAAGTFVNYEGRAQRLYQAIPSEGAIQESWRWIRDMARARGSSTPLNSYHSLDDVTASLGNSLAPFHPLLSDHFFPSSQVEKSVIPRQLHRFSGRTALSAHRTVFVPQPPRDPDSPLAFSMEGFTSAQPRSDLLPAFWTPGWNSVQAVNKFQQEIRGSLHHPAPTIRLLHPSLPGKLPYFSHIPMPFFPREHEWLILPLYQIFGSEELSALSLPIQERASSPFLVIRSDGGERLGLKEGDSVELAVKEVRVGLPIHFQSEFPQGAIGYSMLSPCRWLPLPAWGQLITG